MSYKPNDHYARKAKEENFLARSVYKLEEIDQRFKIIFSDNYILDLGASPGSWTQYSSRKVGANGRVLSIDLKAINVNYHNTVCVQGDINDLKVEDLITKYKIDRPFDAVISDMAPNTTGSKFVDQCRSYDLCVVAFDNAQRFLKPTGNFICKIFEGEDAMPFRDELKKHFKEVHILRPKSTQSSSKEIFLIAKGFLKPNI
ncbi:MAG: RlmE family RNA methyltransferase [Bacteroidota bacterium]